ncbi:hypothetical protein HPP92_012904 [Vanilla planifolia]|uniref:Beta-glucosidase n=1 Tax=Vanilla planifolia TaxID=51239 RepID=A0A835QY10_VANPL|nr:hypothetical protein HPP92_012904 [Vanilla planifolia]
MSLSLVTTAMPNIRTTKGFSPHPTLLRKSIRLIHFPALARVAQQPYSILSNHKPHNSFPPDFVFGAASSAFQVEGATKDGGRGPSIWDTFCEQSKDKVAGGATGEPGAGSYYRYKEDVKLLSDIGLQAYRFSISWSRVLPNIEPFVTIFHWDVPQALEDEYGGFLSRKIMDDYVNYANLLFTEFGGKVKHWITMNEPLMFATLGYRTGCLPPGHCTPDLVYSGVGYSPAGDSIREPYKVAHNILLAHAEAVSLYKNSFPGQR